MTRVPIDDDNNPAEQQPQSAAATESGPAPTPSDVDVELQKLQAERDSLYDRLVRDTAEFRNSQKRLNAEMETRLQFANSSLIKSLLPVIDAFERALAQDPEKVDTKTAAQRHADRPRPMAQGAPPAAGRGNRPDPRHAVRSD